MKKKMIPRNRFRERFHKVSFLEIHYFNYYKWRGHKGVYVVF